MGFENLFRLGPTRAEGAVGLREVVQTSVAPRPALEALLGFVDPHLADMSQSILGKYRHVFKLVHFSNMFAIMKMYTSKMCPFLKLQNWTV